MREYQILAINPGSTSTKMAVYKNENELFSEYIEHPPSDLEVFMRVNDQFAFRKNSILKALNAQNYVTTQLSAIVGRGGLFPPLKAGGYLVNAKMKDLIWSGKLSEHPANLGAVLADALAKPLGIPAFIYDAVSTDEMDDIARYSGFPEIIRKSLSHVLNSKAVGRQFALEQTKNYSDLNLIVCHMGGGISVTAHRKGRIVDVTADDSGPFSPERSGSVPLLSFLELMNTFKKEEIKKKIRGEGGLKAYLGTGNCREIGRLISGGDLFAQKVYQAQAYQIGKAIGEMSAVLKGEIDGIILTGGMAYSEKMIAMISNYIAFLAPIRVYPGERELEALALGGLRLLRDQETPHVFKL